MHVDVHYCHSMFFFFKQKTAYEMRISDWSSDVCSSDLFLVANHMHQPLHATTLHKRLCSVIFVDHLDGMQATVYVTHRHIDDRQFWEIGRASCRERVCQYV